MDMSLLNPPQRRVVHELLSLGAARPPADDELALEVRAFLEERLAGLAQLRPPRARGLRLNKTALDALDCEGRYLDHLESGFAWSASSVLGTLVHRSVELDQAGRRQSDVPAVVAQAWVDFCQKGESAGEFLATLGGVEADALRADAVGRLGEFRECFPLLPQEWTVRLEPRLSVNLHGGALQLIGKPDLVVGRTQSTTKRLMLLVDLKTGWRGPRHRHDMRFYALLATLKYGVAPFRVATYYLDEADWESEDIDADVLEAAARTVSDKALAAARLAWQRPPEESLRLLAGPACRWCARAAGCPAKAEADADRALADPGRR